LRRLREHASNKYANRSGVTGHTPLILMKNADQRHLMDPYHPRVTTIFWLNISECQGRKELQFR
jgi:hypothetical protein